MVLYMEKLAPSLYAHLLCITLVTSSYYYSDRYSRDFLVRANSSDTIPDSKYLKCYDC